MAYPVNLQPPRPEGPGVQVVVQPPAQQPAPVGIGAVQNRIEPAIQVVVQQQEPKKGIFATVKEKCAKLWAAIKNLFSNCLAICRPRPDNTAPLVENMRQNAQNVLDEIVPLEALANNPPAAVVAVRRPAAENLVAAMRQQMQAVLNDIQALRGRVTHDARQAVDEVQQLAQQVINDILALEGLAGAPQNVEPPAPGAVVQATQRMRGALNTLLVRLNDIRGNRAVRVEVVNNNAPVGN